MGTWTGSASADLLLDGSVGWVVDVLSVPFVDVTVKVETTLAFCDWIVEAVSTSLSCTCEVVRTSFSAGIECGAGAGGCDDSS
jgi:hypothetical protein